MTDKRVYDYILAQSNAFLPAFHRFEPIRNVLKLQAFFVTLGASIAKSFLPDDDP